MGVLIMSAIYKREKAGSRLVFHNATVEGYVKGIDFHKVRIIKEYNGYCIGVLPKNSFQYVFIDSGYKTLKAAKREISFYFK
jgi:hypothetical protein